MARQISDSERRAVDAAVDAIARQITWPLGSQGVCEGRGNGRIFEYMEGRIDWNQLTPAEKQEWQRIQPQG